MFAAKGKIDIQAQSDDIEIIAQKVLRLISAQERIEITAREVVINGGGSYVRIDGGGIEQGTTGTSRTHAASHAWAGAKSIGQAMPLLPQQDAKVAEQFVLAELGTGCPDGFRAVRAERRGLGAGTEVDGDSAVDVIDDGGCPIPGWEHGRRDGAEGAGGLGRLGTGPGIEDDMAWRSRCGGGWRRGGT